MPLLVMPEGFLELILENDDPASSLLRQEEGEGLQPRGVEYDVWRGRRSVRRPLGTRKKVHQRLPTRRGAGSR